MDSISGQDDVWKVDSTGGFKGLWLAVQSPIAKSIFNDMLKGLSWDWYHLK